MIYIEMIGGVSGVQIKGDRQRAAEIHSDLKREGMAEVVTYPNEDTAFIYAHAVAVITVVL